MNEEERQRRQEELKRMDFWLREHPGFSWLIAFALVFDFVGLLCAFRFVLDHAR
jgi:hypothetical protein